MFRLFDILKIGIHKMDQALAKNTRILTFSLGDVVFDFEIDVNESIISNNVIQTGSWEKNQLILYESLLSESGVLVDVGANIGINSIYAHKVKPAARIICIEASRANYSILERNISRNCSSNVEAHHMAIADTDGVISFEGAGTNAHLSLTESTGSEKVSCQTLDSFFESRALTAIDLLKIDVEGYTDLVTAKSAKTFSSTRNLIVEFSYGDVENRIRTPTLPEPAYRDVMRHCDELFDQFKLSFKYYYYISRKHGLIALAETADIFNLMFTESRVGDILCTNQPPQDVMSSTSYCLKLIGELMYQNHLRIVQIQKINAEG